MIPPEDIKIEPWPARQRGGQHVGTETGIKVTHLPSGVEAVVNIGRSQFDNRNIAMDMILAALTHPRFR
jgi:protein subunit release factor A